MHTKRTALFSQFIQGESGGVSLRMNSKGVKTGRQEYPAEFS